MNALLATPALLLLLTVTPTAQAQHAHRSSSDRAYHHTAAEARANRDLHTSDRTYHHSHSR